MPLVGVNHLEGHLLAIRLLPDAPEPPFLGLVVSGGHTSLYEVPALRQLPAARQPPATTPRARPTTRWRKMLGLPYPGGLPIDQLAQKGDPKAIRFPRALPGAGRARLDLLGPEDGGAQPRARARRARGPGAGRPLRLVPGGGGGRADQEDGRGGAEAAARQTLVLCGGVAANSRLRALAQERASERGCGCTCRRRGCAPTTAR